MKRLSLLVIGTLFGLLSFQANASPVNVNQATPEEIAMALNGVGPAKASH